jgi:hypothetical protein
MIYIFRRLFRVSFLHDFYDTGDNQIPVDIFIPEHTKILLRNLKSRIRIIPSGFEVYADAQRTGDSYHPRVPFNFNFSLVFYILPATEFYNQTNTGGPEITPEDFYYLSNKSNNRIAPQNQNPEILYLTRPVESFTGPPANYLPGSIVRTGNNTFEALRIPTAAPPSNINWQNLGNYHCVSGADNMPVEFGTIRWKNLVPGATIELRNHLGGTVFTKAFDVNSTNSDYSQNTKGLTDGVYDKYLNGTLVQRIFYVPEIPKRPFGTIEIHHQGAPSLIPSEERVSSPFRFVGDGTPGLANGVIREREFTIRFRNRQTHWLYKFNSDQSISNANLSTAGFERLDDRTYLSTRPIPLQKSPVSVDFGLNYPLPNPGSNPYKAESNNENRITRLISEIFVHV